MLNKISQLKIKAENKWTLKEAIEILRWYWLMSRMPSRYPEGSPEQRQRMAITTREEIWTQTSCKETSVRTLPQEYHSNKKPWFRIWRRERCRCVVWELLIKRWPISLELSLLSRQRWSAMATLEELAGLSRGRVAYVISSTDILSINRTLSWTMVHSSIWLKRPTSNKSITFSHSGAMAQTVRLGSASTLQSATSLTPRMRRVDPETDNNSRRKSTSRMMRWRRSRPLIRRRSSVCNPTCALVDKTLRSWRYRIWWRMRVRRIALSRPR